MKPPPFLSVVEVAARLGCSEATVYEHLNAGRLKSYRPGRPWLISEEHYAQFLKNCEVE